MKQILARLLNFLKSIVTRKNKENQDLKTSKSNFDFRGVFSLRPLSLNKDDYRKEDFLIRILGVAVCSLTIVVVLLALTLKTLLPLQKIQPVFLSVASEDKQVYFVEPLEKKTRAFRTVTESLIHQYIEARESIDLITEEPRYQFVSYLSSLFVYKEFQDEYDIEKNDNSPLVRAKRQRLSRGVQVEVVSFLSDELLQVDFALYDYQKATGNIVSKSNMRATLKITYSEEKIEAKEKFMNPLGLRVLDYSLATKSKQDFIVLKEEGK